MKKWILGSYLFASSACFAGDMGLIAPDMMRDGFFVGLGGNYNSITINQNAWGEGVSNIITSTGANSNGVAQGDGVPFHNTTNTFSPDIQAGYVTHITGTENLYGVKFAYQYLGLTATNTDLYIPQLGQTTSAITGVTTPLVGYVNGTSVQPTSNHELLFLGLVGRSFGNKYIYFGAGPSLFNLKSKNYYSIGYADFNGVTLNVTGLVSYPSPSIWAWGGAAQIGMTYFLSPTWFIDASYTYAVTGNNSTFHQQTFTNTSDVGGVTYTTSGTLYTRDILSMSSQALTLAINKVFDL